MANLQRLCNKNYDVYDGNKKVNDHNFYKFFFKKKKHFFFFLNLKGERGQRFERSKWYEITENDNDEIYK